MLRKRTGRLARKFSTGVVLILLCTLAGTVFANSQITGRLYLREQREYLRKNYGVWSEFCRKAVREEMTDFAYLKDAGTVQKTVYGGG